MESKELKGSQSDRVRLRWGCRIPLRDGVELTGTLYLPADTSHPSPVIVSITPYVAQQWHDFALYFAEHGLPFLTVDARGRGNSDGQFRPFIQEAQDGYDVIGWAAGQPFCDGRVAMWGGSYAGYTQWATAQERPPQLATIVPVASCYMGLDMPMQGNIGMCYVMQWLTLVWGRTLQPRLFFQSESFWGTQFRAWFESGLPFRKLDTFIGMPSETFQEWVSHPYPDAFWDRHNPTSEHYAQISLPILTITGYYDGDQAGALMHYRQHLQHCRQEVRARHYLILGPWDHFGTRTPVQEFCGLKLGPASVLDLRRLHLEWYAWTLLGGPKPEFLQRNVAYYLTGAEKWRYADTVEAITARHESLYLDSVINPTDVFHSGSLGWDLPAGERVDSYCYDPRDVSLAALESTVDPENVADSRMVHGAVGKQLIYHTAPFAEDTELSGFFKLSLWLAIDQPDTDFRASIYAIDGEGQSLLLSRDSQRARYREGLRTPKLITTGEVLRYDFERFWFVSRLIRQGHRLRLVIGPIHSIYHEKNYNRGGVVAEESQEDARTVTVRLFHDRAHLSVLRIPLAALDGGESGHV
jgi:uncharacterized protein